MVCGGLRETKIIKYELIRVPAVCKALLKFAFWLELRVVILHYAAFTSIMIWMTALVGPSYAVKLYAPQTVYLCKSERDLCVRNTSTDKNKLTTINNAGRISYTFFESFSNASVEESFHSATIFLLLLIEIELGSLKGLTSSCLQKHLAKINKLFTVIVAIGLSRHRVTHKAVS